MIELDPQNQSVVLRDNLRELADAIMRTINPSKLNNGKKFDPLRGCENKEYVLTELYKIAKSLGYPDSSGNVTETNRVILTSLEKLSRTG